MRWATRRHCHVDRAACAWLIRRFIDPDDDELRSQGLYELLRRSHLHQGPEG